MKTMNDLPIQIMESRSSGMHAIKLLEDPFSGIIFSFGKVDLNESADGESLHLAFEYEVLDYAGRAMTDMKPFESYIGKLLEEMIHIGVHENSLVYTGGVDENRTEDSSESDSQ